MTLWLERPHPQSAGTTKLQRRVGTRERPPKKNHNQWLWDNMRLSKELTFFLLDRFLSTRNIVGVVRITWGKIWGNNIYRGDEF